MTSAQTHADLPPAYAAAFDAYALDWSAERRALGHAVLRWLFANPRMNSVRPRRAGDELEWRLIAHAEWDALRDGLAPDLRAQSNDALVLTVCALKDFHPQAVRHLPAEMRAQLSA